VKAPAAVAAVPTYISDRTALAHVGLDGRSLLRFVRKHRIPYAKDGRRVLVPYAILVATLDRLAGVSPASSTPASTWSEADMLAKACRRSAGAR
jgi:hypothetical protein